MSFLSKKELIIAAIKKNGLAGLKNLALRNHSVKNRKPVVGFVPFSVSIEPTSACNLSCEMCSHKHSKRKDFLSLSDFKKIVDNNPYLLVINLTGIGEPLLNPGIFEMVKYAKSKGIFVWFFSNGMLFSKENIAKAKQAGVDKIGISIDGATKKTFESIRKGSDFETVLNNTKQLVNEGLSVFVGCVIMPQNFKEMPEMIDLVKGLGVKEIGFSAVRSFGENAAYDYLNIGYEELAKVLVKIDEKAAALGIKVTSFPPLIKKEELDKTNYRSCKIAWKDSHISSDCTVYPCCTTIFSASKKEGLGNALDEPFKKIWNNEKYVELRKGLLENKPVELCKNCGQIFRKDENE